MAVTKQSVRNAIKSYESQGLGGRQILMAFAKRNDELGKRYNEMISAGVSPDEFARTFGIELAKGKTAGEKQVNENATAWDKVKSVATSTVMGLADTSAGAIQGLYGLTDKLGVTKGAKQKYENEYKTANAVTQGLRDDAGFTGVDLSRIGGTLAVEVPVFFGTAGVGGLGLRAVKAGLTGAGLGATRFAEDGDERLKNVAVGAVSGVGGELVGHGLGKVVSKIAPKVSSSARTAQDVRVNAVVDRELDDALRANGLSLADLSTSTVSMLKSQVKEAISKGKAVNPTAVARSAVFDRLGLTPTKAQLSGSAKDWQRQAELAKIGGAGDDLRDKLVKDNDDLNKLLEDMVHGTNGRAIDDYGAIDNAMTTLNQHDKNVKKLVSSAYDSAKSSRGNDVVLNSTGFVSDTVKKLEDDYALSSLPSSIKGLLKDIAKNPDKFTLGKSEEFVKILNREYKASLNSMGKETSASHALGLVRTALENRQQQAVAELLARGGDDAGVDAVGRWRFAKQAYKMRQEQIEQIPLLKDAIRGANPDKLFNKYILAGNVSELDRTVKLLRNLNPQVVDDIRGQVAEYIYKSATSAKSGQPSPAKLSQALVRLGDRRLQILFSKDEVARFKDIEKAMDYMITQPAHSYVNHSNTVSSALNFIGSLIKQPGVRKVLSPVKDVADSVAVKKALQSSVADDVKLSGSVVRQLSGADGFTRPMGAVGGAVGSALTNDGSRYLSVEPEKSYQYEPYAGGAGQFYADNSSSGGANGDSGSVGSDGSNGVSPVSSVSPDVVSDDGSYSSVVPSPPIGGGSVDGQDSGYQGGFEQGSVGGADGVSVLSADTVAGGLLGLVKPPSNAKNQATFERVVGGMVGRLVSSQPMQGMLRELAKPVPDDVRLEKLRLSLEKSREWQDFLKVVPDEQRNALRGSGLLELLTSLQVHGNSVFFNPTF